MEMQREETQGEKRHRERTYVLRGFAGGTAKVVVLGLVRATARQQLVCDLLFGQIFRVVDGEIHVGRAEILLDRTLLRGNTSFHHNLDAGADVADEAELAAAGLHNRKRA